ncbi:MAG: HNH endonuclease family protein, partial [Oscillospiraceae bacterium]
MPAPFMMEVLELNRKQSIDNGQVAEVLALVNTYLIRRYLAGQDTSAISRFFPSYLKNVITKANGIGFNYFVDICKYYLVEDTKQKAMFMPDNKYILQYLSAANAYTLTNIDWILKKIETHSNPVPIDVAALSIEHIMPQKSNEYWDEVAGVDKDEYQALINKLGNLTLVAKTDNSAMGNRDFEHKKAVLEKSKHLTMNNDILSLDEWNKSCIEERTGKVAQKIFDIFPYDKPAISILTDEEDRKIFLNAKGIHAEGYLHPSKKVTVFANSLISFSALPNAKSLLELREELCDKE